MSQVEMAGKLKSGFMLLAGRSAITKVLQIASSLILAYKLIPADYGSFGIIYGFISSLLFLTDIGLGDILIQKKDSITKDELAVYLGVRLTLGLLWLSFFIIIYPFLITYYQINFPYKEYVPWLALILPMESFIGAAIVDAQKNMHFKNFAKIELFETVILYCIQISLAFLNFGIWSFFFAIFLSRLFKTILSLTFLKFQIKPSLNFGLFKGKYRQGILFQLNSIIPTSKAMLLPVILAMYLDIHTIGIIFWTSSIVSIPLVLSYNYNSVMFPALSKMQDSEDSLKELASRSMERMILILAFLFGIGGVVGDQIIDLVFNKNWADAKSVIFLCALYHFVYSVRYLFYPILYVKKLSSKRTIGELCMVLLEYLGVFIFCKTYQATGYFSLLIAINLLALYYFYFYSRDWIRRFTLVRFHLLFLIILFINSLFNVYAFPHSSYVFLSVAIVGFTFFYLLLLSLFDFHFRDMARVYLKKVKRVAI